MSLKILAPLSGWVAPLDEVPDPVFAGRILGDGLAIDPTSNVVTSPCDGVISALAKHAVTVRASNGAEILIHIGLETVALKGEGFTPLVKQDQAVKSGEPLLSFDLDLLSAKARSLLSPVILANGEAFAVTRAVRDREIAAGELLMEIAPRAATTAQADTRGETASRTAVVAHEHGLHARPAAMLANAAKAFAGEVTLACHGRSANAKSAISIMGLGVGRGDEVTLTAAGSGAQAVVDRLVTTLGGANAIQPIAPAKAGNTATRLFGVTASPGRAIGPAVRLRADEMTVPEEGSGVALEITALQAALAGVRVQLSDQASTSGGARREILEAHLALLEDPELVASARQSINQGKSAAYAWRKALGDMADVLRALKDPRQRERIADLRDLERQVVVMLLGNEIENTVTLPPSAILIAEEFLPSDLSGIDAGNIGGLLSAAGGPTSHVAILAAGMNIPALFGAGEEVLGIADDTELLLDAGKGFVDLKPEPATIAAIKQSAARHAVRQAEDRAHAQALCVTADGTRVEVFANLGKGSEEAAAAVALGAEGCGLLRTEFLFMDRTEAPGEVEQREAYQAIADALGDRPLILRTFDIGADKPVAYLSFPPEDNPQLGLRGIRAGLAWPDLLRSQLKAALHVKPGCKLLLPMVSMLSEVEAVRTMVDELCHELSVPQPDLGAMIETPASAMIADRLLTQLDFVSIGTNDLTQYTLAMDRTHGRLAKQLDGLHPAVLRLIARTAEAANAAGKLAAVCGGLATDPAAVPILIGLGIRELSVPAPAIPRLKSIIRSLRLENCRTLAHDALEQNSAAAVRALVGTDEEGLA